MTLTLVDKVLSGVMAMGFVGMIGGLCTENYLTTKHPQMMTTRIEDYGPEEREVHKQYKDLVRVTLGSAGVYTLAHLAALYSLSNRRKCCSSPQRNQE